MAAADPASPSRARARAQRQARLERARAESKEAGEEGKESGATDPAFADVFGGDGGAAEEEEAQDVVGWRARTATGERGDGAAIGEGYDVWAADIQF